MTATAVFSSTVSEFDTALARHLAARTALGARCDAAVVQDCYARTRLDLEIEPDEDDPCARDIESCFAQKISSLIESNRRFIAGMPEPFAAQFILDLLMGRSRR